ncbi:MAG: histidine kinase, partial [Phycisphaerales bacterium]|nr:histidine kinase [Phycisphaerales bacterium]
MPTRLGLGAKFNLILLAVFLVGAATSWFALNEVAGRRAQGQVAANSDMLRKAMNSVRDYTGGNIGPHLKPLQAERQTFIPETVPGFAAREVFERFRQQDGFADFLYKEAAPNPTNLRDKADDFEEELVKKFAADPSLKADSGFRTVNGQPMFYSASPIPVKSKSCLECHTTAAEAPAAMVNVYGPDNGFGWRLNDVVAAQVVYVPAARVIAQGRQDARTVALLFAGVSGLVILLINLLLRRTVLRPLANLAAATEAVGQGADADRRFGDTDRGRSLATVSTRGDELGELAGHFGKMADQVREREQKLRDAQDKVAAREAHFRALIENASDAVVILEPNGTVRYASPAVAGVLGTSPEALVGQKLLRVVDPAERDAVREAVRRNAAA